MPPTTGNPASQPLVREPIYHQLNERLRQLIHSGEYPPGNQFLTERAISSRFQISRATANKALASLVTEGLLEFRKGIGTFICPQELDLDIRALVSFTARASQAGLQPETRVLVLRDAPADSIAPEIRSRLKTGKRDVLKYMERLRLADGQPVILERRWLVGRHVHGLTAEAAAGSLYEWLTHDLQLVITGADQTIRARCVTTEEARLLHVSPGMAALEIAAIGRIAAGPLWWEETLYRGDTYSLRNVVGVGGSPATARTGPVLEFAASIRRRK